MTPSLLLADNSGMIASRTTKSDMRIRYLRTAQRPRLPGSLLFFRIFFEGWGTGDLAGWRPAAVVLDFLLIPAQLTLQLVHHQVDGRQDVAIDLAGDKIMLVLRRHQELHYFHVIFQVHG